MSIEGEFMILLKNEYITLEGVDDNVFLQVHKAGVDIKKFGELCNHVPRFKLTKFGSVKNALDVISDTPVFVGLLKPVVEVIVSSDEMMAYIIINLTKSDYDATKESLPAKVLSVLKEEDVVYGINMEVLESDIAVMEKVLIAEGTPATHGQDAIIEYYEFSEKKPLIKTDGNVNHYELDLIDNVDRKEWIGKKVPPTLGTEGMTVKSNPVSAKTGRDYKIKFDPDSVFMLKDSDGVENLYAKNSGAVKMKNSRICVDNHLVVTGDVEYSTGNIDFDGYVTITGTVKDKFTVTATNDISINGDLGLGATGLIHSKEGSVLLKGGVNGKGISRIVAKKDIYTKYANEATLECEQDIHVGLYAIDSTLIAQKVILPPSGRIIGGNTKATLRIESGSIGNKLEKPTYIEVEGFERCNAVEMLEYYTDKKTSEVKKSNKLKRELEVFENNLEKLDEKGMTTYEYMIIKHDQIAAEINDLNAEIRKIEDILKTKGEGEVSITNSIFPKTSLEIKEMQKRIKDKMTGSFYVKDKELHHKS